MPFARPSLTALRNQAIEDISTSGVPGLNGLLRNAVLRVLAWVMAGLAYSVYGYIDWIARKASRLRRRTNTLKPGARWWRSTARIARQRAAKPCSPDSRGLSLRPVRR